MAKQKPTQTAPTADFEEKWKRALADYQNLEKRVATERAQFIRLATVGVIEKFLGALDDLERAAQHLKDPGLTMVINQFGNVLASEGVEIIEADGKPFDPHAMDCVEKEAGEKGVVLRVVKKGYKIGDVVVRPAQVVVGE